MIAGLLVLLAAVGAVAWVWSGLLEDREEGPREWVGPGSCLPLAIARIDARRPANRRRWS